MYYNEQNGKKIKKRICLYIILELQYIRQFNIDTKKKQIFKILLIDKRENHTEHEWMFGR